MRVHPAATVSEREASPALEVTTLTQLVLTALLGWRTTKYLPVILIPLILAIRCYRLLVNTMGIILVTIRHHLLRSPLKASRTHPILPALALRTESYTLAAV